MGKTPAQFVPDGFGERLADIRKRCGLTQEELGKRVGMSQRLLTYYETRAKNPPVGHVAVLARALDVSVDELIYGGSRRPSDDAVKLPSLNSRVWKAFEEFVKLSPEDQRAIAKQIRALTAHACV